MAVIVVMAFAHLLKWLLILMTLPLLAELLCLTLGAILPASGSEEEGDEGVPAVAIKRLMIVVPSHNEELSIARCVQSLEAASGSAKNVIVVAHNCSDATAAIAQKTGAHVEIVDDLSLAGKGHALKHGFDYAFNECGADAVMIVDADSTVSANITTEVAKRLANSAVVQCRYQVRNHAASWRAGLTALAFLGINVVRPRGRDRLGLSCGIFGNGFAMRKDVLESRALQRPLDRRRHGVPPGAGQPRLPRALHPRCARSRRHAALREHFGIAAQPLGGWKVSACSRTGVSLLRAQDPPGQVLPHRTAHRPARPAARARGLLALSFFCSFPANRRATTCSVAFGIILLHLVVVIHASPDRKESLRNLLLSPVYLFWRVTMVTSVVRASSKGAAWVRTTRDASAEVTAHDMLAPKTMNSSQESS